MEKIKAYGICLYKYENNSVKILLCKSVHSQQRWGFLKGVVQGNETKEETALREFYEESSIKVKKEQLEEYFDQDNELKDIGIYLVNYDNIKDVDSFFKNEVLYEKYLCHENTNVQFFDINTLPLMKKKQKYLTLQLVNHIKLNKITQ